MLLDVLSTFSLVVSHQSLIEVLDIRSDQGILLLMICTTSMSSWSLYILMEGRRDGFDYSIKHVAQTRCDIINIYVSKITRMRESIG